MKKRLFFIKKIIRKLYHLIWFLSVFFIVSLPVNAVVNINGADFVQSPQVNFYDNTNGSLTSVGASFYQSPYEQWVSSSNLSTNGANTDGANIAFTINSSFVSGYTYALSVLIGMENSTLKASSSRICIAENLANSAIRYSNSNFPCTNAIAKVTQVGYAPYTTPNGNTFQYGVLTIVFTADFTSPSITFAYQSVGSNYSSHTFGGYHLEVLAQPNNGLTQQQVQSIINNSGLATSNSVSEVQQSIEEIQSDINSSATDIIDNQQQNTDDIIQNDTENTDRLIEDNKKNFQTCRDSVNLFNKNDITTGKAFIDTGELVNVSDQFITTGYIDVLSNTQYTFSSTPILNRLVIVEYTDNKTFIVRNIKLNTNTYTITTSSNTKYVRLNSMTSALDNLQFELGSSRSTYESYGEEICSNKLDNIDDTLNDDSAPSIDLSDIETSDTPISDLVTLPLTLLNSIYNGISGVCSNWTLPLPFNNSVLLECFTISDYVGSSVASIIDTAICLFMAYRIILLFIAVFNDITTLSDTYTNYVKRGRY